MSTPEDRIAKLAPTFVWNQPHCRATDPVVEYAVDQGDPALRPRVDRGLSRDNSGHLPCAR